ncbi:MAG: hypothetical protein ABIE36_03000 [Candidatus Diapherotrites archaeon]
MMMTTVPTYAFMADAFIVRWRYWIVGGCWFVCLDCSGGCCISA